MRLEWIRCFHEVAGNGSITKAAAKLYITQPAATKMIHALEAELGEMLFIRTTSGVQLTEQGKIFERFARKVLKDYEGYLAEKNAHKELASAYAGTVELAISPLLLQTYYQALTMRIKQRFPQINLCFIEADTDAAIKLLGQNALTLGAILTAPAALQALEPPLAAVALGTSPIVVCMSKNAPYAGRQAIDSTVIPVEKLISIEFAKQSSLLPQGAFNSYTINLEVIRQKLLSDDEVCVTLPQMIAEKVFAASPIVQLKLLNQTLSAMGFFYNRTALEQGRYSALFLQTFAQELRAAVFD